MHFFGSKTDIYRVVFIQGAPLPLNYLRCRPVGSSPACRSPLPLSPREHHACMWLLHPGSTGSWPRLSPRYDGLTQSEVDPQLEELLGLVVWLTTCGRSELKVFDSVTYPQLEGFKFHHEASGGSFLCMGDWKSQC